MTEEAGSGISPSAEFGLIFTAAREDAGMAIAKVADALHLDDSVISAIENGRFAALPMRAYVRGYVRNYARVLGLDPDDMAARFDGLDTGRPEPSVVVPRRRLSRRPELALRPLALGYVAIIAVLLIVSGAVLWTAWQTQDWQFPFFGDDEAVDVVDDGQPLPADPPALQPDVSPWPEPAGADETAPAGADDDGATGDAIVETAAEAAAESQAVAEQVVTVAEPTNDEQSNVPEAGVSLADAVEDATAAPAVASAADIADEGDASDDALPTELAEAVDAGVDEPAAVTRAAAEAVRDGEVADPETAQLTFTFEEDSWVRVLDANGRRLFRDLGRAGRVASVTGETPFAVVVGFAPGIRVEFDGEVVDLEPHTNSRDVADLRIGN